MKTIARAIDAIHILINSPIVSSIISSIVGHRQSENSDSVSDEHVQQIRSGLRTWTDAEATAAATDWAASREAPADRHAAFVAGAAWAADHQTTALTDGIAHEVKLRAHASTGVAAEIAEGVVSVANAAVTGGTGAVIAAVAVAAVDVVQAAEARTEPSADDAK